MDDRDREFIERQVSLAEDGCPEYEIPGDEDTDPQGALLEKFPHQALLKQYLIHHGYIVFQLPRRLGMKTFNVLGARGNIAWCCDPNCDKVIVDMPISLYLDEGKGGEIAQHEECFKRNLQAGHYSLPRLPKQCP